MDEQKELRESFRQQQEKYVYYVIALCVASIGFSIYVTIGQPLKLSQIPLGIAILGWGLSIYCGLRFLSYVISTLFSNHAYFEIIKGRYPGVDTDPEKIKASASGVKTAIDNNTMVAEKLAFWQERLFYLGAVSFIIWHVTEMYLRT